jgi:carbon monoxide dehydrogenase subunit G
MDIEKLLVVAAPPARVWALLLDPKVMGACVPGMKSIEVISDSEYLAEMHVKIAFVSARFKIKTTIVEARPPSYLRSEGTGEDTSVASSLKQVSEIFLKELPEDQTEILMKIRVDVLGRLGTFGLSVMKTKADRMWDEFGLKLAAQLAPPVAAGKDVKQEPLLSDNGSASHAKGLSEAAACAGARPDPTSAAPPTQPRISKPEDAGWWARLKAPFMAPAARHSESDIVIEVQRADSVVTVRWPVQSADACAIWLREYLK